MKFGDVIELGNSSRTADVRSNVSFQTLMISAPVLQRMSNHGFKYPSPVQEKAIPAALSGLDILVQAKSGTGKTLVFSVMAVENLNTRLPHPQRLILAPTREIAGQIRDTVKKIATPGTRTTVLVGGTPLSLDKQSLQKGTHIVIGTTGRICQLLQDGVLSLQHVELFVLDEADKLMDDSFQKDINFIFSCLPPSRQVAVFSATYPRGLDDMLGKYMRDATLIRLNSDDVQLVGIKQYVSILNGCSALEAAERLFSNITFNQALVFCNSHAECEPTCSRFAAAGFEAAYISSQMAQSERERVIESLKRNKLKILVSTDLTARGIDATNVNLVVNIGAAGNAETYFHRIGRAARFGGQGASVTLLEDGRTVNSFSQLAQAGGVNAKLLDISKVPSDLTNNSEFHGQCNPFVLNKKRHAPRVVAKVKMASAIPQAVDVNVFENAVARTDIKKFSYDREEMFKLSQNLPRVSEEFMQRIRDLDVGHPDFAAEAEQLVAQMKAVTEKKPKAVESEKCSEAKAEVKFKFVPSRLKAKKKFYLRGEMLAVRDAVSPDAWLRYAETKFNLEEDPFVKPKLDTVTPADDSIKSSPEPVSTKEESIVPNGDGATTSPVVSADEEDSPYRLRKPKHAYTRVQMLSVQKAHPKKVWLDYVKSKWDTTVDPWQLDPQLRCPVNEQLRIIRDRERQQRQKVLAERQLAAEKEPKLHSSSRHFRRLEVNVNSFTEWSAKVKEEFENFKKNPPVRKGPVVPVRDNPKLWKERTLFYCGWLENFEKRFATATRISSEVLKEQAVNTEEEVVFVDKPTAEDILDRLLAQPSPHPPETSHSQEFPFTEVEGECPPEKDLIDLESVSDVPKEPDAPKAEVFRIQQPFVAAATTASPCNLVPKPNFLRVYDEYFSRMNAYCNQHK